VKFHQSYLDFELNREYVYFRPNGSHLEKRNKAASPYKVITYGFQETDKQD